MNTVVTSREAILKTCREMVAEKGLSAINMRSVAEACHVALGSLYYYFPSKGDLMIATIESVWEHIFHAEKTDVAPTSFIHHVDHFFNRVRQSMTEYPHFFTMHSISLASSDQARARDTMERYLSQIANGMHQALQADLLVKPDAFRDSFSEADFIDFVLSNLLASLLQQKSNCNILLEVIRRTIYSA